MIRGSPTTPAKGYSVANLTAVLTATSSMSPRLGDPCHLVFGVGRRDVRIETAARGRHRISRNAPATDRRNPLHIGLDSIHQLLRRRAQIGT